MAQLLVRNVEENVKERLKRRAKKHGCSFEEGEIRELRGYPIKPATFDC